MPQLRLYHEYSGINPIVNVIVSNFLSASIIHDVKAYLYEHHVHFRNYFILSFPDSLLFNSHFYLMGNCATIHKEQNSEFLVQ